MAENYQRQSALAHLGLVGRASYDDGAVGIRMAERAYPCMINLRGKPDDGAFLKAAESLLGTPLPLEPNRVLEGEGEIKVIWLSPEEWWVLDEAASGPEEERQMGDRLRNGLADCHFSVTEVGESRTRIRVAGPHARDLLAKGCPLDLHPRQFGELGQCAQTVLAKATVLIHLSDENQFDIFVLRSFSDYLWHWLADAAQEYGLAIVAE